MEIAQERKLTTDPKNHSNLLSFGFHSVTMWDHCSVEQGAPDSSALSRLVTSVQSRHAADLPLTAKTHASEELRLLWEVVAWEDAVTCQAASHALSRMVQDAHADFHYVMHGFLGVAPHAKRLTGVLDGIANLLLLQTLIAPDDGSSPYGIRDAPHPFITVLVHRPECWSVLHAKVCEMLFNLKTAPSTLPLLDPFLRFCFLDPRHSEEFLALRLNLASSLVQCAQTNDDMMKWLLNLLPLFQISSAQQTAEVQQLISMLLRKTELMSESFVQQLVSNAVGFLAHCCHNDHECCSLVNLLRTLAQTVPEAFQAVSTWLQLSSILTTSPPSTLFNVLQIMEIIVGSCSTLNPLLLNMATLPLLMIISLPDASLSKNAFIKQTIINKNLASNIISEINDKNYEDYLNAKIEPCPLSCNINVNTYTYDNIGVLTNEMLTNDANTLAWLKHCGNSVKNSDTIPDQIVHLVSSVLLTHHNEAINKTALGLILTIAKIKPELSPSLLTLLLFRLNTEPASAFLLLRAIPEVITHKVAVGPALRFMQVLRAAGELKATSISLMTDLWKAQERCYPHLHESLTTQDALDSASYEIKLAKAASIRDICVTRPHQHGSDLLPSLSAMLLSPSCESGITVLCLQAMRSLCLEEVVDTRSTWDTIGSRMKSDERASVLCEVCTFLSLASSQDCEESKVTAGIKDAALKQALLQGDDPEDIELPAIEGQCFVNMLPFINTEALRGFGYFLQKQIEAEVKGLPRAVFHSSYRKQSSQASHARTISTVPDNLIRVHKMNKQPALNSSLSISLLFGYDPTIPTGRDGKSTRQHVMQHGKAYHQMLYTLMTEISPENWHQSLMLPYGWVAFMAKCFGAYTEMRKAECDLILDRGEAGNPDENRLSFQAAWLWARDKLTDLIKSMAKGNPKSTANAVHALAALVDASTDYSNGLDADEAKVVAMVPEHLGQGHWVNIVTNTLLSIVDVRYEPSSRIFNLSPQRGVQKGAPHVVRASACLALSHLIPHLITSHTDLIYQILESLMRELPSTSSNEGVTLLHLHHGIGLGLVLARLFEERFVDVAGTQSMVSVWKAVYELENICFGTYKNRQGSILGLGVALAAMCSEGRTDTKVHVSGVQEKLFVTLGTMTLEDDCYEQFTLCLAITSGAMYAANILSQENADCVVVKLYEEHCDNPENGGVALSLGTLCNALQAAEHPTVTDLSSKLSSSWLSGISGSDSSTNTIEASITGLLSLSGISKSLISVQMSALAESAHLSEIIKVLSRLLTDETHQDIRGSICWLLGLCYHSASCVSDSRASLPLNYHYLPTTSLLRALIDLLLSAIKYGQTVLPEKCLESALESFVKGTNERPLPPFNWSSLLSPLIRMGMTDEWTLQCLTIGVHQSLTSASAALFVSSWLNVALFDGLKIGSKVFLLQNLNVLLKVVSIGHLQDFLERSTVQCFMEDSDVLKEAVLTGVLGALKREISTLMCLCLSEIPGDVLERIISNDFNDPSTFSRGIFTRAYLVSRGERPLTWLNSAIEAAANQPESVDSLSILAECFHACKQSSFKSKGALRRLEWLLGLMGHIRAASVNSGPQPQVLRFLLQVLSLAVLCWAPSSKPSLLIIPHQSGLDFPAHLWSLLPEAMISLLSVEPWKQSSAKVVEWLRLLCEAPCWPVDSRCRLALRATLIGLRHSPDFRKAAVWSKVLAL
ncbi:hypothetical protein CAPTEDRAFT_221086 [Capitella teleta]|uniref:Uncharacterized protein n=1 Tax=Capitella teleta TaxID=283909 RepID=R7U0R6_CAPTE|nr:hypothetical protein CAPTEDRAFT_221086 [Capitella teleta]|eukprot:ELT97246.1 hypothetical protein CAPTEDRAFT_221086 [Capitella teleta]